MSKKVYFIISLSIIVGIIAAWHFLVPSKPSSAENSNDVPDLGAEAPISVKVQYARQGTLVLRLTPLCGATRARYGKFRSPPRSAAWWIRCRWLRAFNAVYKSNLNRREV